MSALIEYIAKALVDKPDQVSVRAQSVEGGTLVELKVAPDDVGKVIGRDGRTVNAMRTLLSTVSQRTGEKLRLEILDDRRNGAGAAAGAVPGAMPASAPVAQLAAAPDAPAPGRTEG